RHALFPYTTLFRSEQVVEAHGAELVDDHRRALERRIAQQARKERRLAAAEESGDDGDRQRAHRRDCAPMIRRPTLTCGASSSRSCRSNPDTPACTPSVSAPRMTSQPCGARGT